MVKKDMDYGVCCRVARVRDAVSSHGNCSGYDGLAMSTAKTTKVDEEPFNSIQQGDE